MNKIILLLAISTVLFLSCTSTATKNENSEAFREEHTSENSLDWAGTYEGVLPCASCPGIKTKILLNSDLTFSISKEYLDAAIEAVVENGSFKWVENGSSVALPLKTGEETYKVGENFITLMFDDTGSELTQDKELNELYTLKKTD